MTKMVTGIYKGHMMIEGEETLSRLQNWFALTVMFKGPEIFKKKGRYFKKNSTYPVALNFHQQIGDRSSMDSLASCAFVAVFILFTCWWKLTARPTLYRT